MDHLLSTPVSTSTRPNTQRCLDLAIVHIYLPNLRVPPEYNQDQSPHDLRNLYTQMNNTLEEHKVVINWHLRPVSSYLIHSVR